MKYKLCFIINVYLILHFKETYEVMGLVTMSAGVVAPLGWFTLNKKYGDVTEAEWWVI
jgi:hypothetical protein